MPKRAQHKKIKLTFQIAANGILYMNNHRFLLDKKITMGTKDLTCLRARQQIRALLCGVTTRGRGSRPGPESKWAEDMRN